MVEGFYAKRKLLTEDKRELVQQVLWGIEPSQDMSYRGVL